MAPQQDGTAVEGSHRPSSFTQEKADAICERLSDGESLRSICRDDDQPATTTVLRWLRDNEPFRIQYAYARDLQADAIFDEMLEIADDGNNDWMEKLSKDGQSVGWVLNGEAVQRSKLRIDSRKWIASKLNPKKYGDKVETQHSGTIEVVRREMKDA